MSVSRRQLLAACAGLLVSPSPVLAGSTSEAEALLALLPDRMAAARLSARWVQQERKEPGEIRENLQRKVRRSSDADATTLRRDLADAVREDFQHGTVVKVEGWEIARTQAELCALAYFWTAGRL